MELEIRSVGEERGAKRNEVGEEEAEGEIEGSAERSEDILHLLLLSVVVVAITAILASWNSAAQPECGNDGIIKWIKISERNTRGNFFYFFLSKVEANLEWAFCTK